MKKNSIVLLVAAATSLVNPSTARSDVLLEWFSQFGDTLTGSMRITDQAFNQGAFTFQFGSGDLLDLTIASNGNFTDSLAVGQPVVASISGTLDPGKTFVGALNLGWQTPTGGIVGNETGIEVFDNNNVFQSGGFWAVVGRVAPVPEVASTLTLLTLGLGSLGLFSVRKRAV